MPTSSKYQVPSLVAMVEESEEEAGRESWGQDFKHWGDVVAEVRWGPKCLGGCGMHEVAEESMRG
jgi:hypothetical protein